MVIGFDIVNIKIQLNYKNFKDDILYVKKLEVK